MRKNKDIKRRANSTIVLEENKSWCVGFRLFVYEITVFLFSSPHVEGWLFASSTTLLLRHLGTSCLSQPMSTRAFGD